MAEKSSNQLLNDIINQEEEDNSQFSPLNSEEENTLLAKLKGFIEEEEEDEDEEFLFSPPPNIEEDSNEEIEIQEQHFQSDDFNLIGDQTAHVNPDSASEPFDNPNSTNIDPLDTIEEEESSDYSSFQASGRVDFNEKENASNNKPINNQVTDEIPEAMNQISDDNQISGGSLDLNENEEFLSDPQDTNCKDISKKSLSLNQPKKANVKALYQQVHFSDDDSDDIQLITDTDKETLILLKKLDNMNMDIPDIEKSFEPVIEPEEPHIEQSIVIEEEEEEVSDSNVSFSDFDLSPTRDQNELLTAIQNLQIDKEPESIKPLQVFDPAYTKESLSTKDHAAEKQFHFQDSFVYRDIYECTKPYKERGKKWSTYDDLDSHDLVGVVVDPSRPEKEIMDFLSSEFNQADEARILTQDAEDKPIPEYEIMTQYPGEIESVKLESFLDFYGL